jgi:hypothetical protein
MSDDIWQIKIQVDFLWRLVTSDSTTAVLCDSKRHLISIVKYDGKPGILALIRVKDVTLQ